MDKELYVVELAIPVVAVLGFVAVCTAVKRATVHVVDDIHENHKRKKEVRKGKGGTDV